MFVRVRGRSRGRTSLAKDGQLVSRSVGRSGSAAEESVGPRLVLFAAKGEGEEGTQGAGGPRTRTGKRYEKKCADPSMGPTWKDGRRRHSLARWSLLKTL